MSDLNQCPLWMMQKKPETERFRFTGVMRQHLDQSLRGHHTWYDIKCTGNFLENLVSKAVKSDNNTPTMVHWDERGHREDIDMQIENESSICNVQVKSGTFTGKIGSKVMVLSGPRMGGSKKGGKDKDFALITANINAMKAFFVTVPCQETKGKWRGKRFVYRIGYIRNTYISDGISADAWLSHGSNFRQISKHGVTFQLRPTMSWQLWWEIPLQLIEFDPYEIVIG